MRVCELHQKLPLPTTTPPATKPSSNKVQTTAIEWLLSSAHAIDSNLDEDDANRCYDDQAYREQVAAMTNQQFFDAYQLDQELKRYNDLIQQKMDDARKQIEKKLFARMPQCRGKVDFIEVPNLFYPESESGLKITTDEDGNKQYDLKKGLGSSFLPNPTNGVMAGDRMIFSHPQNSVFGSYLDREIKGKTGLDVGLVDSWNYAHIGNGNVHCSTHAIRFCKPRSK